MRKTFKSVVSILMAVLMLLGCFTASIFNIGAMAEESESTVAKSGEGWEIKGNELKLTANVTADEEGNMPWYQSVANIKVISISDEVTEIADGAFKDTTIVCIFVPDSVESIGKNVFESCKSLTIIYYAGDYDQWKAIGSEVKNIKVSYLHEHTEEIRNAFDAICGISGEDLETGKDGYSGDTYCTECGSFIKAGEVLDYRLAHKWSEEKELMTAATCKNAQETWTVKCTICGTWNLAEDVVKYKEPESAPEHDFSVVSKKSAVQCGEEGAVCTVVCTICGTSEEKSFIEHEFAMDSKAATCLEDGYTRDLCKYCDKIQNEQAIKKIGHDWKMAGNKVTCTEDGENITKCSVCDAIKESTIIKAEGHKEPADYTIITYPTCTNDGERVKYCTVCKEPIEETRATIPNYHTPNAYKGIGGYYDVKEEPWEGHEPTCTEIGANRLICNVCSDDKVKSYIQDENGEFVTTEIPIDLKNHTVPEEFEVVEEATCEKDGYAVKNCKNCEKELDRKVLPKTGHNFINLNNVTCAEGGVIQYKCENCDFGYEKTVEKGEHDYINESHSPTCTEPGYESVKCKNCTLDTKSGDVSPLGHTMVEDNEEPTCTEDGYTGTKCTKCDYVEREIIPALDHEYKEIVKQEPTCTVAGILSFVCTRCDYENVGMESSIPCIPHQNVTTHHDATCEKDGYDEIVCSVCNSNWHKDNVVSAIGHDWDEDVVVDPTCTKDGKTTHKCKTCSVIRTVSTTPKLGHMEITDEAVEATCSAEGKTEGKHCQRCGDIIEAQEKIKKLAHTYEVKEGTPATCTEDGKTDEKVCAVCGETIKSEVIPATGHGETTQVEGKAPTCTEEGLSEGEICTVCNETVKGQEVIMATGHTEVVDAKVEPTCTETGLTEGKHCSVCNEIIVAQEVVPETGHRHTIEIEAKEPGCETIGFSSGIMCTDCGEIISAQNEIDALGHVNGEPVIENNVEQTCTKDGSHDIVIYCTVCEKEILRDTVKSDKLGHKNGDAVKENEVDATCETADKHDEVIYCTECKAEVSRKTIEGKPFGHKTKTKTDGNTNPTCTKAGKYDKVEYCTVCNKELSRKTVIVPALGHTNGKVEIEKSIKATCVTPDKHDEVIHCTVCKAEVSRKTIEGKPLGHKTDSTITKEATPFKAGEIKLTCTVCGTVENISYRLTFIESVVWIFSKLSESFINSFKAVEAILAGVNSNIQ